MCDAASSASISATTTTPPSLDDPSLRAALFANANAKTSSTWSAFIAPVCVYKLDNGGPALHLTQNSSGQGELGSKVWEAAPILSKYLEKNASTLLQGESARACVDAILCAICCIGASAAMPVNRSFATSKVRSCYYQIGSPGHDACRCKMPEMPLCRDIFVQQNNMWLCSSLFLIVSPLYLVHLFCRLVGKRVVEIGSGTGLVGLVAHMVSLHKAKHVSLQYCLLCCCW